MLIIGFAGKKFSGKDTCANIFSDYLSSLSFNCTLFSFAYPLKEACKILFNFTDKQLADNKEVHDNYWNVTPRKILQYVGTDLFRNQLSNVIPNIKDNFWIYNMNLRIKICNSDYIIITDVRFNNELEFIKNNNGIVIFIDRDIPNSDNHISENSIKKQDCDYIISNNLNIIDLEKNISNFVDKNILS